MPAINLPAIPIYQMDRALENKAWFTGIIHRRCDRSVPGRKVTRR